MSPNARTPLRRLLTAATAAVAAVLLTALPAPATAQAAPAPVPVPAPAPPKAEALRPLAVLSAQRLATADLVAAAKWGTGSPVDDPARERQVLDAVARRAVELGTDPRWTSRIFRDQIEANKAVQRGLHRRWAADPAQVPAGRPDLGEVRKEINRVNDALVRAIAASGAARTSPGCLRSLAGATVHVRHERHLDVLHTVALARSVRSVCGSADRAPAS
ncbi:chorismate mutase [Streptomyces sp. CB02923]|uniref:chorismate mutase n=1 Tax=Streptomyces sp. CB02923 TaxID=1718985 RepID=UPI00093AAE4F|nr:chorismate mutase [Streptomyces sp. CB02923]OKH98558.1 chorismate mutase [Streptomyces sp. CB02923]